MFDNQKRFVAADFGSNVWSTWDGVKDRRLSKEEFARLRWLDGCRQIVAEYAHLQVPRNIHSKSQVYTNTERQEFLANAEKAGVRIFCFPHGMRSTYRPGEKVNGEDLLDAIAMHKYLVTYVNQVDGRCWLPPLKWNYDFDTAKWRAIHAFRGRTNEILNWARAHSKEYATHPDEFIGGNWQGGCDAIMKLAGDTYDPPAEGNSLRPAYQYLFDGKPMGRYTVAAMICEPNGKLRINENTGEPPGVNWIMRYQLGFTPLHHRGGVARSNIQFHGLKNFTILQFRLDPENEKGRVPLYEMNRENRQLVLDSRSEFRKAVKLFLTNAKKQYGNCYSTAARRLLSKPSKITSDPVPAMATQCSLFDL
jgi:hypothetical protein